MEVELLNSTRMRSRDVSNNDFKNVIVFGRSVGIAMRFI